MFALLLLLAACGGPAAGAMLRPAGHHPAVAAPAGLACSAPAPTTSAGYRALFASLDPAQWGAADVAISVALGRRSIWLFGDTLSSTRFVHSTAVTQERGCLHVSHGGAQLLPDDRTVAAPTPVDPALIYWIHDAHATGPDSLVVTARAIEVFGTGPWQFRDRGFGRRALVTVDARGDATFRRWLDRTAGPAPDPGPMIDCEAPAPPAPHHVCYGRQVHPELRLADGTPLVTVSQNWDDGRPHPLAAYRPLFSGG